MARSGLADPRRAKGTTNPIFDDISIEAQTGQHRFYKLCVGVFVGVGARLSL